MTKNILKNKGKQSNLEGMIRRKKMKTIKWLTMAMVFVLIPILSFGGIHDYTEQEILNMVFDANNSAFRLSLDSLRYLVTDTLTVHHQFTVDDSAYVDSLVTAWFSQDGGKVLMTADSVIILNPARFTKADINGGTVNGLSDLSSADADFDSSWIGVLAENVDGNQKNITDLNRINVDSISVTPALMFGNDLLELQRSVEWKSKTQITVKRNVILIGSEYFYQAANVDKTIANIIDTGSISNGKDYCVYACDSSDVLVYRVSLATTFPAGYDANSSRKLGGFHTLCTSVGTIAGHTLTGYVANDILPASVWDLNHRPVSEPAGMVYVDAINKWVDIYLPSGTGASTLSVNGGTISDTRDWMDFVDDGGAVKKRLMWDMEFQIAAAGSNEETNIAGSADPVTTGGHSDTAGRRMISNIGCEDMCGAMWQWLLDQSYRYDSDGTMIAASKTLTIYHAASPGGNPIYVKYGANGRPYLCCNMATDAVDKWLTFGSAVTFLVKHDADAATGGYQVYFDEDATQPSRLLCALPGGKSEYLDTSDPNYPLKVTYNATPATPGVAINYDDGADERLEFISPTTANGTLDLASFGLTFAYYNLPGAKGSLYRQSAYGDVKLLAGGSWARAVSCGSRGRFADAYRWGAAADVVGRFCSEEKK